jgi:FAD/FMN-containing dehydrogenase
MNCPAITRNPAAAELACQAQGPVLAPGDPGFDAEIAPFNLATTHQPALVLGAASTADVAAAVRFAAARGLAVGVQATGHGAHAPIEDALLISTRRMNGVRIDPAARTATIEAGAKWRQVITAAARHGLAPLNGSSSDVGVIGYTLGGGLPVIGRTFGFAADHVRSLQVVTADGAICRVDPGHEPGLYWALRGGGGSFGIVTSLVCDLVPVARLYGGGLFYPGTAAPQVLRAYREWSAALPDSISTSLALLRLPPLPQVPEPLRGQFVVNLCVAAVTGAADGERLLAPMRAAAPLMIDSVTELPYTAVDSIHRDPEHPAPVYEQVTLLPDLSPDAVQALLAVAGPQARTPVAKVALCQLGGALSRPPAVPNAVGGRHARYAVQAIGVLVPEIAAQVPDAVQAVTGALAPHSDGSTLVNFHGVPGDATDRGRPWPAEVYTRLRQVKAAYDPANMFRFGHAIPPAANTQVSPAHQPHATLQI